MLGLTFTILGLSLQTATFGVKVTADIMELVSWGALLISGLAGLYRGQWKPQLYFAFAMKAASNKASNEDLNEKTKSIQQKMLRSFKVQKW